MKRLRGKLDKMKRFRGVWSLIFASTKFKFFSFVVLCGEHTWNYCPQGTKKAISFSVLKCYQMCANFICGEDGI